MDWDGNTVIEPEDGPKHGLPSGVGAVLWKLLEQTKSNRTARADVPMTYTTGSSFSLGKWMHRLRDALGLATFPDMATPIFCHENGTRWTSQYFRSTFLIPMLDMQRPLGTLIYKHMMGPREILWLTSSTRYIPFDPGAEIMSPASALDAAANLLPKQ
jgi:hypothetical protein